MRAPPQARLFEVWERGCSENPLRRSLALLAAALPGVDEDTLARSTVGRRDAALLGLRAATFGPVLRSITECPECGAELESAFPVDDLLIRPPAVPDGAALHRVEEAGFAVEFRLPSVADLLEVAEGAQRQGLDQARRDLLSRCVAAARRGEEPVPFEALPPETLAAVSEAMAAIDPQADLRLEFRCPACSHRWEAPFDIAAFLWTELAAAVQRTAREVHALASAYGWSEADILSMSAARRRLYLEQVAG